jgi:30S ribosomal protein S31
MGKGDKKTRLGKINNGSYGKLRPKKKKSIVVTKPVKKATKKPTKKAAKPKA